MVREVERRHAIALLVSTLTVASTRATCDRNLIVELSDEAEKIIQCLIRKGRHQTREEVLGAALDIMMAQDGVDSPLDRALLVDNIRQQPPEAFGSVRCELVGHERVAPGRRPGLSDVESRPMAAERFS